MVCAKKLTLKVGLAILTIAIVPMTSPLVSASPGMPPIWRIGQTWAYQGHYAGPGPAGNFSTALSVVAMDAFSAVLRTEDSWEFGVVVAETVVSLSDFSIAASNVTLPGGQHSDQVYTPPLLLFSFPLSEGKTWESPTSYGTYSYRVLPLTQVTTSAGVFDAFPVEQQGAPGIPLIPEWTIANGTGRALVYYAGDVGQIVKYESFDSQGDRLGVVEITSPAGRTPGSPSFLLAALVTGVLIAAVAIGWTIRKRRPSKRANG